MFNFKVVSPDSVVYYKHGYIELLSGKKDSELIVHLFLFEPSDSRHTPKYANAIKNAIKSVEVKGEYIPEVDSHCLTVSKPGLALVINKVNQEIKKALSATLGGE